MTQNLHNIGKRAMANPILSKFKTINTLMSSDANTGWMSYIKVSCKFVLFAILVCFGKPVVAAGFDCTKASSDIEKLICSDEKLSELDSELARLYQLVVHDAFPLQGKANVIAEQKSWITNVRDRCENKKCLLNVYEDRLSKLSEIKGSNFIYRYVTDDQEIEFQRKKIEERLHAEGISGNLAICTSLIRKESEMPALSKTALVDSTYGGICEFNGKKIMVCNQSIVGSLVLKLYGFSSSGIDLANFSEYNCPDGG